MPAKRNQSTASVTMSSSMVIPGAKASAHAGGKLRDLVSHGGGALTQATPSRRQSEKIVLSVRAQQSNTFDSTRLKRRGLLEQGMGGCPNKPRRYRPNLFRIGNLSGLSAAILENGTLWLICARVRTRARMPLGETKPGLPSSELKGLGQPCDINRPQQRWKQNPNHWGLERL
jgi:hypothetical protein